jgi:hypothetical protein
MRGAALGVGEDAWATADAIVAAAVAVCAPAPIAPHALMHTTQAVMIVRFPIFIPYLP